MSENDTGAFLLSVSSSMEADMIESLLKANDIPVLRKYREAGGYMMIMMGGTVYGVDLYVPGDMLDKAREIVDNSRKASEDAAFPDNIKPEEMTGEDPISDSHAGDIDGSTAEEPDIAGAGTASDRLNNEEAVSAERDMSAEEQKINRRRRSISWLILFFFVPGLILLVGLIKYLFDLFAGK